MPNEDAYQPLMAVCRVETYKSTLDIRNADKPEASLDVLEGAQAGDTIHLIL